MTSVPTTEAIRVTWVGVDPGGRTTGLVVRDRDQLIAWELIERGDLDMTAYCRRVAEIVGAMTCSLAVEDVVAPTPHMGLTSVTGLLDTAQVIGAIRAARPDAVMVRPNRHGKQPLQTYPPELVGARESAAAAGRLRHCRAAWDVAGHAQAQARLLRLEGT